MELNDNAKETYIQLLIDSLVKKQEVLNELMEITTRQQNIIDSESFEEDEFLKTISLKEEQIKSLEEMDRGFELVYDRVRENLSDNRKEYIPQITTLKERVTIITDLSVRLQALEKRNKPKLEALLANKRKNIRNSRLSNETVTNYYKNMSSKTDSQSYFYDKKK